VKPLFVFSSSAASLPPTGLAASLKTGYDKSVYYDMLEYTHFIFLAFIFHSFSIFAA
jgi:hypothetical protein